MSAGKVALGVVALAAAAGGGKAIVDRATWARDMRAAILAELPQLTPEARLLVLSHAAYESGWGNGPAARRGYNVFNITTGSAWSGDWWEHVDGDTDGAGNKITQKWRIYADLRAAVKDYWRFLGPGENRGRYAMARAALEAGDLPLFVARLSQGGYFTLNAATYTTQLSAVRDAARAFS